MFDCSGTVDTLDRLHAPLVRAHRLLTDAATQSAHLQHDVHTTLRAALRHQAVALVGLGGLTPLSVEMGRTEQVARAWCEREVGAARGAAAAQARVVGFLRAQVGVADRRVAEQSALLESCVFQHIGTVHEMSNRFYTLQDQYNGLQRREAPGPADAGVVSGLREMVGDLKTSLTDSKRQLVEVVEREGLGRAEVVSALSEARAARAEAVRWEAQVGAVRAQAGREAEAHRAALGAEQERRREAERDCAVMEARLQAALAAMSATGMNAPLSQQHKTE
jgi:hypothetical protein